MNDEISLRFAKEDDFQEVLEISEGIYDGRDYLPFVFHEWLKTPNKYVFVADLQSKLIGFLAATMIDGGQTILCQGLRIHRDYRGRGYSYHIMSGVIDRVRGIYPRASKVQFVSSQSNRIMSDHFSKRLGYKVIMVRSLIRFEVNKSVFDELRKKYEVKEEYSESKALHELGRENALEFVLNQRKFDGLIPYKFMVVENETYELLPANASFMFRNDAEKMFIDVSTEELRKDVLPRSFSHGRMDALVKVQRWTCNIYTKEQDAFKAHLIRQLMAAIEQLEKVERKSYFEVLFCNNLEFDPEEVLKEVVVFRQQNTVVRDGIVLHEKA